MVYGIWYMVYGIWYMVYLNLYIKLKNFLSRAAQLCGSTNSIYSACYILKYGVYVAGSFFITNGIVHENESSVPESDSNTATIDGADFYSSNSINPPFYIAFFRIYVIFITFFHSYIMQHLQVSNYFF